MNGLPGQVESLTPPGQAWMILLLSRSIHPQTNFAPLYVSPAQQKG